MLVYSVRLDASLTTFAHRNFLHRHVLILVQWQCPESAPRVQVPSKSSYAWAVCENKGFMLNVLFTYIFVQQVVAFSHKLLNGLMNVTYEGTSTVFECSLKHFCFSSDRRETRNPFATVVVGIRRLHEEHCNSQVSWELKMRWLQWSKSAWTSVFTVSGSLKQHELCLSGKILMAWAYIKWYIRV